ncbi:MAG: response regulator transcription factor [Gammaproteobacteria bacterium]
MANIVHNDYTAYGAHGEGGRWVRILAVDDHMLFRRCLADYLAAQDGMTVVGEAASPQRALELMEKLQPDMALVDIDLGGDDGLQLAGTITGTYPDCAVIILTASEDEAQMLRAMEIGASGYLVKDVRPENLVAALRLVRDGETVFARTFVDRRLRSQGRQGDAPGAEASASTTSTGDVAVRGALPGRLSQREIEVLGLVSDGLVDKQVADRLGISESTVKNHMRSIRRKLGASNRVQASLIGMRSGLIAKP